MARKKSHKALFEVITGDGRKADKQLGVPGWFGQAKQPAREPSAEPAAVAAQVPSKLPRPMAAAEREPVLSTSGGRLRISLSSIAALLILLGLIALMAVAFALGRVSVRAARGEAIDAPRKSDVPSLGDAPPGFTPLPGGSRGRRRRLSAVVIGDDAYRPPDYYYLVIQAGIESRSEAEHVKRFLYENRVDATIHPMRVQGRYMVKDLRGFKDPNGRAVRDHVENTIRPLGRAYVKDGGGKRDFGQAQDIALRMMYQK